MRSYRTNGFGPPRCGPAERPAGPLSGTRAYSFRGVTFAVLPRTPARAGQAAGGTRHGLASGSGPGAPVGSGPAPHGGPARLPRVVSRSSRPPPRRPSSSQARAMPTPKKMNTSVAASECATRLLPAVKAVDVWSVEASDRQKQERPAVAQLLPPPGPPQPDRETSRAGQANQPEHQAGGGDVVARPQREQRDPHRVNQGGECRGGDCCSTEASSPVSRSGAIDTETNSRPVRAPATPVLPRKKLV